MCYQGKKHKIFFLLAGVLALAGTGCGRTGAISGTVTYKGKPLPGGIVAFLGQKNTVLISQIKPDGSYLIENIPVGEAQITVETYPPPVVSPLMRGNAQQNIRHMPAEMAAKVEQESPAMKEPSKAEQGGYVKIPDRYRLPDQSELKYTVKAGSQTYDIKLD